MGFDPRHHNNETSRKVQGLDNLELVKQCMAANPRKGIKPRYRV